MGSDRRTEITMGREDFPAHIQRLLADATVEASRQAWHRAVALARAVLALDRDNIEAKRLAGAEAPS
jgi:hypothetical protein